MKIQDGIAASPSIARRLAMRLPFRMYEQLGEICEQS